MHLVMCLACGEFVRARKDADDVTLLADECPNCGGRSFKDVETGDRVPREE
jgi:predicted  nucleic acid-binding Zn-ribbon protein